MKNISIVTDTSNNNFKKKLIKEIKNKIDQEVDFEEYSLDNFNHKLDLNIFLISNPDSFSTLKTILGQDRNSKKILFTKSVYFLDALNTLNDGALFGAFFFEKPIESALEHIRSALILSEERFKKFRIKEVANREILKKFNEYLTFKSEAMHDPLIEAFYSSTTDDNVIIFGATGVGKELIANAIHKLSSRSNQEMLTINCSNYSKELAESELFGHVKGSFTGAHKEKDGLLKKANSSTLFMDEIGDLDIAVQAKVLRVLDEPANQRSFYKVGSIKKEISSVRIIAATSKLLNDKNDQNQGNDILSFRKDLYYRFPWEISIPPLNDRKEDIDLLCQAFFEENIRERNTKLNSINPEVFNKLKSRKWPGNIRELKNMMKKACTRAIQKGQNIELSPDDFFGELEN